MANKQISENIEEAKEYLNDVESMGMSALNVADRILESNKLFVHNQEKIKEITGSIEKIMKDYNNAVADANRQNKEEPESYEKHIKIANYLATVRLEKTQKLINFWDRINDKL